MLIATLKLCIMRFYIYVVITRVSLFPKEILEFSHNHILRRKTGDRGSEIKNYMHGKMGLNSNLRLWNLLLWLLKCQCIYFIRFVIKIESPRPKPCMRASFKPLCHAPARGIAFTLGSLGTPRVSLAQRGTHGRSTWDCFECVTRTTQCLIASH